MDLLELRREVQHILDNLTPFNFETSVEDLKFLNINTEEKLNIVVDLVYWRAVYSQNYFLYVKLSKKLELIKVLISGQTEQYINFRKLLLTKCQATFEEFGFMFEKEEKIEAAIEAAIESANSEEEKQSLQQIIEATEVHMKRKKVGNIRLIGEMLKLNMIIEHIIHDCIKKLIRKGDDVSLECLCELLKMVGKELSEKNKKGNKCNNLMDQYITQMQEIIDSHVTSSRVKFIFQDIVNLKKNNWVPREDGNIPKTINSVLKGDKQETQQQMHQTSPTTIKNCQMEGKVLQENMDKEECSSVSTKSLICSSMQGIIPTQDVSTQTDDGDFKTELEKLLQDMETLLLGGKDCDVTLVVLDEEFLVHRAILSARSSVLDVMCHEVVETNSGVLTLTDSEPDIFRDFLLYLYTGRVKRLSSENVIGLYLVADKYNTYELKMKCVEYMKHNLSISMFCSVAFLSLQHPESDLLEAAINFFLKNMTQILETVEWQIFMKENPVAVNELYIKVSKLYVTPEEI